MDLAYKSFYLGSTKISALDNINSSIGDEIRNFKTGILDYPKLIIDSFSLYYKKLDKKHDVLLYIPSNKNKNVMDFIATEISNSINIPIYKNIAFKKKIKEQKLLDTLTERKDNVLDSFVINNSEELKNKNILIIDDVYASGETIKEVLKEFRKVEIDNKNIEIIVFALREYAFNI